MQLTRILKFHGSPNIRQISGPLNRERRIVPPLIRISDLDLEGAKLFQRFLFCVRSHPTQFWNVALQRVNQVQYHFARVRFCLRWKIFFHVNLAQRLSNIPVYTLDAALPSRLNLLRTGKFLAIKIEILLHESVGQLRCTGVYQVPAKIRLPLIQRSLAQQPVCFLEKIRLLDIDSRETRRISLPKICFPGPGRNQRLQSRNSHLVPDRMRIPHLRAWHRSIRQRGLKIHHRARLRIRLFLRISGERKHFCDVHHIIRTQLLRFFVRARVIIAFRQGQPALSHLRDYLRAVVQILCGVESK